MMSLESTAPVALREEHTKVRNVWPHRFCCRERRRRQGLVRTNSDYRPILAPRPVREEDRKRRFRVRKAVLTVLIVHGLGLMAMLFQGARHPVLDITALPVESAAATVVAAVAITPLPQPSKATPASAITPPASSAPNALTPAPVAAAVPAEKEYKITKGDTLRKIARKHRVTLRALVQANPGVHPSHLQVGQVIEIPS